MACAVKPVTRWKNLPSRARASRRRQAIPRRQRVFVVVHRHDDELYYKRLTAPEHQLLAACATAKR